MFKTYRDTVHPATLNYSVGEGKLPGVALIPETSHSFGVGGWVFVFGIVFLIVLGLVLIYGRGDPFRRRTAHRASRAPGRDGDRGHRTVSRRRPNRP